MLFATCAPGLEAVLHEELRALGMARLERQVKGVRFEGTMRDAFVANLWLRTAVRVLWRVARFTAPDAETLYRGAAAVDWSRYLGHGGTLRCHARSKDSSLRHTRFVSQCVKDAIVDQFRERRRWRPDVAREHPDLRVHVQLHRDVATLSVDTSGESLHKRGWRRYQGHAPLAETLAAALVLVSDWDGRAPLLDPFCGSGTILVEAAWLAAGKAPGGLRRFACERFPGADAEAFAEERRRARDAEKVPRKLRLVGRDLDARHVAGARRNLEAAGVSDLAELAPGDFREIPTRPGWNARIVTNPPYGRRLADGRALRATYRAFAEFVRERCGGYGLAVLVEKGALAEPLRRLGGERIPFENGGLRCEILRRVAGV